MKIFRNDEPSNYEWVTLMGPKWWTEYAEMDANYQYAGWTLDLMAVFLEKLVTNQFPGYMDEEAVAVLERLLGIDGTEGMTLDERRTTLKAYYFGGARLSRTIIRQIIKAYTGCESDVIREDGGMKISISRTEPFPQTAVRIFDVIARRMPAHISFDYLMKKKASSMLGVAIIEKNYRQISAASCADPDPLSEADWFNDEVGEPLVDESGILIFE